VKDIRVYHGQAFYPEAGDDEGDAAARDPKVRLIAERFRAVMEALDLDLSDPNLADTPLRVAKAYRELFAGLRQGDDLPLRTFPNADGYSQMVALVDVPFASLCAHHFLPFFGSAHLAYLPQDRIVGLSKLARAVDHYAHRPQIQERMTEQVMSLLKRRLRPQGAMVVLQARHLCMEMRGVRKPGAVTTTSAIHGVFEDERVRAEFLGLLPHAPRA
jgi:GTP cyclohydrolase I